MMHSSKEQDDLAFRGRDGHTLFASTLGSGPLLVLLHGGGPDRRSLLPLAERLRERFTVALPDIRGYGASICVDPARHTWHQYADDVFALLDHLGAQSAALGGAGLGSTITLRAGLLAPERLRALVLMGVEDIEDDEAKAAETAWMEAFFATARAEGIERAWEPVLPTFAPVVGAMVRDAISRTNLDSFVAAGAIAYDRAFRAVEELAAIRVPTLVIPADYARHPRALAEACSRIIPNATLARAAITAELKSIEDFARALAPEMLGFLEQHRA